ncbi:MAG: TIGR01440 family protein [Clostridia bacterium]|nr:TIGR01440 family protein [Clostridia bacterium]
MGNTLYEQARLTAEEICREAGLKQGNILVIGGSTSEICGDKIGTNSAPEVATEVFCALHDVAKEKGIYLAVQCCEHLNRAIVTERAAIGNADTVNVIPQPKAGGSMATKAYASFSDPVVVESIRADAGLDIGLTLIGMHLKPVAVPIRLKNNRIGEALVVAARTRPKFIGGARAVYDENLL